MTLCPVALAFTCKKCPAFSFCPLKTVIGDEKVGQPAAKNARPSARSARGSKKS
ncbi:MAG: hypothetical protein ACHQPI_06560 [Thermoanaerobaculia bacterium]